MKKTKHKVLYPVIEIKPNGKPDWGKGAWCITFVYADSGNFVLKGFLGETEDYLFKFKNSGRKFYYVMSLWNDGKTRNIEKFYKDSIGIFNPDPTNTYDPKLSNHWMLRKWSRGDTEDLGTVLYFKRLPRKWIPEFEKL